MKKYNVSVFFIAGIMVLYNCELVDQDNIGEVNDEEGTRRQRKNKG